jgi:dCMP deaminase
VGRVKVLNNTMKPKFVKYYMEIAELTAKLSYAVRLNVGAVIVKGNQILASGFNGMPSGWENVCEEKQWLESDAGMWLDAEDIEEEWPFKEYRPDAGREMRYKLKSKPETMHAERNALDKVAASNESTLGATLFVTHSPCLECAKSIYNTGISDVYYKHDYRSNDGIEFLKKTGVKVHKYAEPDL